MSEFQLNDQIARSLALDPQRSFIVQAPAGSGKTGLLIQRYLALLSVVDQPEEILAITFTRKAAAEMRERIRAVLELAGDEVSTENFTEHEQKLYELASKAFARDAEKKWGLLANSNRMQILTIDAFCARIVAAMPVASRFGGMPSLVDDANEIYKVAIENYFKTFLDTKTQDEGLETVLLQFNNDFARVSELLVRLLAKRDQWLSYVANQNLFDTSQLNQALEVAISQDLSPLLNLLSDELCNEIVSMASYAAETLRVNERSSDILACQDLRKLPEPSITSLNVWRGIKKLLLTDAGKIRSKVTIREGFAASSASDNPEVKTRAKEYKERMHELLKILEGESVFISCLFLVGEQPYSAYTDEQMQFISALFTVLKKLAAELMVEFQLSGQIDFIELTQSALQALGDDENPTDLALIFDSKIKHVLIDEFQDTSRLHLELLRKLTLGWQDDNRSLFVVGDPMQSIYKFRDADVGNFLSIKEKGINALKPEYLQLESNFRSDKNLVELNNQIFKQVLGTRDNLLKGEIAFHASQAFHSAESEPAITLHTLTEKSLVAEAKVVINTINAIREKEPDSSIGVLVRSRTHLEHLIPSLREHGLSSNLEGMEKLSTRQEVLDIYSLCMALVQATNRQAWLSVLRAPWCGLSLGELEHIAIADENALLIDNLRDTNVLSGLNKESIERISILLDAYDLAFNMLNREPLGLVVEGLWEKLNGKACLESVEQIANVERFFALLRTQTISSVLSISKPLASYLSDFTHATSNISADSVQVMTIHMSKGLEFDHVILPSASRSTRQNDSELLVWQELSDEQFYSYLLLAVKQISDDSQIYQYIQKRNRRLDVAELKRLFYVAMTRSVKSTHIFCHTQNKNDQNVLTTPSGSFAALLKPSINLLHQNNHSLPASESINFRDSNFTRQRLKSISTFKSAENIHIAGADLIRKDDIIEYEWASETAMHIGTVVHLALKQLGTGEVDDWLIAEHNAKKKHFTRVLRALGVPDIELDMAVKRTVAAVNSAATDQQHQWIFSSEHTEIENEYPISGFVDGEYRNFRIDRTFVDAAGTRWIIDYKTSSHEGSGLNDFLDNQVLRYKEQLDTYAVLMQQIDNRNIKLGMYFPLMQAWREWGYEI